MFLASLLEKLSFLIETLPCAALGLPTKYNFKDVKNLLLCELQSNVKAISCPPSTMSTQLDIASNEQRVICIVSLH